MIVFKLFKHPSVHRHSSLRMTTFTSRDLANNYINSETLMHRFVRYLAITNSRSAPLKAVNSSHNSNYFSNLDDLQNRLRQIPNHQLVDLVISTSVYRSTETLDNYTKVINDLDAECSKRVRQLNFVETIRLLHGFLYVIPARVSRLIFYRNAMELLVENFNSNKSVDNFVQICFFLGMWKKNRHTDALMTRFIDEHLLEYLNSTSTIEFCIISTALYKTSIKQNSNEFAERLENEIINVKPPIDEAFLVTFIKSCTHNAVKSKRIKEHIKDLLRSSQLDLPQFMSLVHLFEYYAANLDNDKEVCDYFVEKCMDKIRLDYRSCDARGKDFGTFLWSCGQLNLNLPKDDLKAIEQRILDKISRGEYRTKFIDLIDSCLSMWILNYKSEKLIRHAFENDSIVQPQLDYRANLLKSCVQIENPKFLTAVNTNAAAYDGQRSAPKYMRDRSPNLMRTFEILRRLSYDLGIRRNNIVSPINYFYIPGIRVQFENSMEINLEIFESNYLLGDGKTPTGMFSLKTRLLKRCGCTVIQINLASRSDEELTEYMKTIFQELLRNQNVEMDKTQD